MLNKINYDKLRIVSQILFLAVFIILSVIGFFQGWMLIFVGAVLASLLFSRLYCGWICPISTCLRAQIWISKRLGIKRFNVPGFMQGQWLRWIWLILFIGANVAVKRLGLPVNNMLLNATALGLVVSLLFAEELWHKCICPFGTVLSISSQPARLRMNIDEDKCIGCGLCQKACINNTITGDDDEKRKINNKECLLCFKCREVCPVCAVQYGSVSQRDPRMAQ